MDEESARLSRSLCDVLLKASQARFLGERGMGLEPLLVCRWLAPPCAILAEVSMKGEGA